MPARDVVINARLAIIYGYTASVLHSDMGSILGATSGVYSEVNPVTLSAQAKEGYEFDGWYNEKSYINDDISYTFDSLSSACDIIARFTLSHLTYTTIDDYDYCMDEYSGTLKSLVLPDMHKGKIITGILTTFNSMNLDVITILSTSMLRNTFAKPFSQAVINKVIVSEGITVIPAHMFNSSNLKSIELPESLLSIGYDAFWVTSDLTSIDLPTSLNSIGANAFFVSGITSINIPNCNIGDRAFIGCSELTSVTFDEGLESIPESAFEWCKSLVSIKIPNSVKSIGVSAFDNCESLKDVTLSNNLISIGNNAFRNTATESIEISESVETIGSNTFMNSNLKSVKLDASIDTIPNSMFEGAQALTTVELSPTIVNIGDNAFKGCKSLTNIPNNKYINIGSSAFQDSGVSSIDLTGSNIQIANSAFYNCTALTSINFENVDSIGESSFRNTGLSSIDFTSSDIKSIPKFTFAECANLNAATLDGITSIYEYAFLDCTSLSTIILDDNLLRLETGAFKNCTSLRKITVPSQITARGTDIFMNCNIELMVYLLFYMPTQIFSGATIQNLQVDDIDIIATDAFENATITNLFSVIEDLDKVELKFAQLTSTNLYAYSTEKKEGNYWTTDENQNPIPWADIE
jgi:hypothetical protein